MKSKKIGINAILIVLIAVIPCATYIIITQKHIRELIAQKESSVRYYDRTILKLLISHQYAGMQFNISDSTSSLTLDNSRKREENAVFIWYPKTTCQSCFTSRLNLLSSFFADHKSLFPIMLTNSPSIREIRSITNSYNINSEIIQISSKSMLDTITKPILFKLTPKGTIVQPICLADISEKMLEVIFLFNFKKNYENF